MRIDQFVPGFAPHDAISNHVLQARRALRSAGFESEIWAEDIHQPMRREARDFHGYPSPGPGVDNVLLYHASTGSSIALFLHERPERLFVDYHNITPSRFFARWEPVAAAHMDQARAELRQLAPLADLALADSRFNQAELNEVGYRRTAVAPLLVDFSQYQAPPNARVLTRLQRQRDAGGSRWLFVGRVSPNKCQHDVIGAFAAYRRLFDPRATLTLVGGMTSRLYWRSLEHLVVELELGESVSLADSVSFGGLLAYYRTSDVFVCLSEHEGFCIPILEAMYFGVPVVAYAAAAVPDTVGTAGVVLTDKDPLVVACAVDRLSSDDPLRASLVAAGRDRVDQFSLASTSRRFVDSISRFLSDTPIERV
jgi:glycosyltransferase involved in cell wall biosynthesis